MPLSREYLSGMDRIKTVGTTNVLRRLVGIRGQVWTDPAAADTDGYSASHTGAAAASTRDMTLGGVLAGIADYARNVVITVTHGSAVVAMSGTIYGTDINGNQISEAWSVTAGGTSKVFTGAKAFKTVTRITETVAADASTNTIIAGTGNVLGLDLPAALGGVGVALKEIAAGSLVATGTLVAASQSASADRNGTYLPATVPNASNDYSVYYLVDDAL